MRTVLLSIQALLSAPVPEDLAARATTLLRDPSLARRLADAARQRVRAEHTVTRMLDRLVDVYDEVCSETRR